MLFRSISKLLLCLDVKSIRNQSINSLSELKYDVALPIPSLQTQFRQVKEGIVSTASRKRKKTTTATTADATAASAVKVPKVQIPSTIFAGVYDTEPSKLLPASSKKNTSSIFKTKGSITDADQQTINELTSEEKLILFIRGMDGKGEKLLNHLIWIAESCCRPCRNFALQTDFDSTNIPEETFFIKNTTNAPSKKRKIDDGSRNIKNKKQKRDLEKDVVCISTTESSKTRMCVSISF